MDGKLLILLPVSLVGLVLIGTGGRGSEASFSPGDVPVTGAKVPGGEPAHRPLARGDFYLQIRGKKPAEVRTLLGPPDSTKSVGGLDYWYYFHKSYDVQAGRVDQSAQVVFDVLGVKTVNFY